MRLSSEPGSIPRAAQLIKPQGGGQNCCREGWLVKVPTLLLCILLTAVACEGSSATERFRQHFKLAEEKELTPESARQALLTKIHPGAAEQEVYEFLKKAGIGSDGLSSFYPANTEGVIVCRIEFDRESPGVVKESYGVFFLLDQQRRLRDVKVEKWLTGP